MKSSVEEISPVKKKLIVEVEADEVERKINKAYRDLGKQARLPGFRPGKIPMKVLEGRFGREVLSDVTRELINETLPKALEDNDTFPLNVPNFENDLPKKGELFRYTATMEVRPSFELDNYKSLEVEKEILSVGQEDVDRHIEEIRRARGHLKPVEDDRGVLEGDHAEFSYRGMENGTPVEGLEADDYTLRIGSGDFHPEFEKGIIGVRKGEAASIRVNFEEDYRDKNLAGRGIDFEIELKDIKEMELPALDDEFAKGLGGHVETFEELKEEVKKELIRREEKRIDQEAKTRLIRRICDNVDFMLPESLVEQELNSAIQNIMQNLSRSGTTPEMAGLSEDSLREELLPAAESRVKRMLVLAEIARQNDLNVTDEDVSNGFLSLAAETGQDPGIIRRFYEAQNLTDSYRERLLEEKTLNFLMNSSSIKEVDSGRISKTES
ncbi:MAG: trigger factor [Thermodesulfobacteriota bacterium]